MKPSDIVAKSSPMQLFEEYTFLHQEDWRKAVTDRCLECRAIPEISYHEQHGWLFHTLSVDDRVYRKGCSNLFDRPQHHTMSEREFETEISDFLTRKGIPNKRQVHCETGIVDIATDNAVIEVKLQPRQDDWLKAIGQAVSYRSAIGVRYAVIMSVSLVPNWVAKSCRSVGIECFNRNTLDRLAEHITREN